MSGPQRPGYAGKVEVSSIVDDKVLLTVKDEGLLEYLRTNGNDYVASFTPVGPDGGSDTAEAPAS